MRGFTTCLWLDSQAEEAARFYSSIFKDAKTGRIVRYGKDGFEFHQKPEGSVMTVEFQMAGQNFLFLNGGHQFKFNESVSIMVNCETQQEVDYYWEKLTDGGQEGPCGWLKDKFGLSWQIAPTILDDMMADPDPKKVARVTKAFFQMKKFDIETLKKAYAGKD